MKTLFAGLVGLALLVAAPGRAAEDTPLGRAMTCYGMSYGLVELLLAANDNLEQTGKAAASDSEASYLAGLVRAGNRVIQGRALSLIEELEDCLQQAANRAVLDAGAFAVVDRMAIELDAAADAIADYKTLYERYERDFDTGPRRLWRIPQEDECRS